MISMPFWSMWGTFESMYSVVFFRPEGWPLFMSPSILNVGYYTQTLPLNSFLPSVLIGTSDSYHFVPFSVTLILMVVIRLVQIKFCWFNCFRTLLSWMEWGLEWGGNKTSWSYAWTRFIQSREIPAVLLAQKIFDIGMFPNVYEPIWF